jgi:hypothetical protein
MAALRTVDSHASKMLQQHRRTLRMSGCTGHARLAADLRARVYLQSVLRVADNEPFRWRDFHRKVS